MQAFCTVPKVQNSIDACKSGGGRAVPRNSPFLTLFFRSKRRLAARPNGGRARADWGPCARTNAFCGRERSERAGGGGAAAARPGGRSGVVGRRAVGRLSACALAAVRPFRVRLRRPRSSAPLNFAPPLRCRPSGALSYRPASFPRPARSR